MNKSRSGETYVEVAEELGRRILALIPAHPEILEIESAWALFLMPGFHSNDLGPTMDQMNWALGWAKATWLATHGEPPPP